MEMDRVFDHEKISSPDGIRIRILSRLSKNSTTKRCTLAILIPLFFPFFISSFVQIATRITSRNTIITKSRRHIYIYMCVCVSWKYRQVHQRMHSPFDRSNSRNMEQVLVTETIWNHPIILHPPDISSSLSISLRGIRNNLKLSI